MVNVLPLLFFNGSTRAYFEKTSMHVRRYLYESFSLESKLKSARSACHSSFIPFANVRRLRNFVLDCLCSVYNFSPISHSRAVVAATLACRLIECTPLKLPACEGSVYNSMFFPRLFLPFR